MLLLLYAQSYSLSWVLWNASVVWMHSGFWGEIRRNCFGKGEGTPVPSHAAWSLSQAGCPIGFALWECLKHSWRSQGSARPKQCHISWHAPAQGYHIAFSCHAVYMLNFTDAPAEVQKHKIEFEEELASQVFRYPQLYDSSHKDYKDSQVIYNSWWWFTRTENLFRNLHFESTYRILKMYFQRHSWWVKCKEF